MPPIRPEHIGSRFFSSKSCPVVWSGRPRPRAAVVVNRSGSTLPTATVLTCEHLARLYGTCAANPHRDCRLVVQRLGRDSVSAGSHAEEGASGRIFGAILVLEIGRAHV